MIWCLLYICLCPAFILKQSSACASQPATAQFLCTLPFRSHVQMWEVDPKECWAWKNWCFQTVVLKKTLESPLDSKEIKPVNLKGNQPWTFIGRTDAEPEASVLWSSDAKSWLIRKDPDAGKDWGQEEKGVTRDEMVGWRHPLNGHEFEETPRDSGGERSLVSCSPWGHKIWTWLSD